MVKHGIVRPSEKRQVDMIPTDTCFSFLPRSKGGNLGFSKVRSALPRPCNRNPTNMNQAGYTMRSNRHREHGWRLRMGMPAQGKSKSEPFPPKDVRCLLVILPLFLPGNSETFPRSFNFQRTFLSKPDIKIQINMIIRLDIWIKLSRMLTVPHPHLTLNKLLRHRSCQSRNTKAMPAKGKGRELEVRTSMHDMTGWQLFSIARARTLTIGARARPTLYVSISIYMLHSSWKRNLWTCCGTGWQ